MNKRGISNVVATVLIMLITVAAVILLWVGLAPILEQDILLSDFQSSVNVVTNGGYTFYNPIDHTVTVQVESRGKSAPEYIQLSVVLDNGDVVSSVHRAPDLNSRRLYYLDFEKYISVLRLPRDVSVAPIIIVDGREIIGDDLSDKKLIVKDELPDFEELAVSPDGSSADGGGGCEYSSTGCPVDCFGDNNPVDGIYEICTCDDLQQVNNDLTADYILMNDIDCSDTINWNSGEGFVPFGDCVIQGCHMGGTFYTGNFDGDSHVIDNLYINRVDDLKGLFGANAGTIRNLGVRNVQLYGGSGGQRAYVGGLVGHNEGTIENCFSNFIIDAFSTGMSCYAGGLVGQNYNGVIRRSYSKGRITTSHDSFMNTNYVGGLVGIHVGNAVIEDSFSISEVVSNSPVQTTTVGGLVGRSDFGGSSIQNSYAVLLNVLVQDNDYFGGLLGSFRYFGGSPLDMSIINSFGVSFSRVGTGSDGGLYGSSYDARNNIVNSYWNNVASNMDSCYEGGDTNCNVVNDNQAYFYDSSNAPMNSWDFTNVWLEVPGSFPVLR